MNVPRDFHLENGYVFLKKNKRRIKTPDQVAELELFYKEDKYPSDEKKFELGAKIGLTEKQISVWLCHRRLKDKKEVQEKVNTNKRKDHSSGVIQDRGSGLWQDSCGSTKPGDQRWDPKEVESKRIYTGYALDENRMNNIVNPSSTSNTSSKTSSPFREHPCTIDTSTYSSCYGNSGLVKPVNGVMERSCIRPSGYLKVKGEVENVAVISVKRQLGSQYRKDGPSLGIEFQPLPPGAFGSPILNVDNEYHDVGNHVPSQSSNLYGPNHPPPNKVHQNHNYRTGCSQSGERDSKYIEESPRLDRHFLQQRPSSSSHHNSSKAPKHSADMAESFVREKTPLFKNSDKYYPNSKQVPGLHRDTASHHIHSPKGKITDDGQIQKYHYHQNSALTEQFDSKLNLSVCDESVDKHRGSSRRESYEE